MPGAEAGRLRGKNIIGRNVTFFIIPENRHCEKARWIVWRDIPAFLLENVM